MTQPMIRAYSLHRALAFIDEYFEEPVRERAKAEIPDTVRENVMERSPVDWCPIEDSSAILRAISSAKNDPQGSYRDIVECGKFISTEATNTFYKLLLRVVTPSIFLSKMQSFWTKDFQNVGHWDVRIRDDGKGASLTLSDVEGLDHIAPLSEGFIAYVLRAMGYDDVRIDVKGWSLEEPGPRQIDYEIQWA